MSAIRRSKASSAALICVAAAVSLIWITPLVMVVLTAMKSNGQFTHDGFLSAAGSLPRIVTNARQGADLSGLWDGFRNSLFYGVVGSGLAVLIAGVASYAIVSLRIRFGFLIFMLIYAGTALPFQLYIMPLNKLYQNTGLYDTVGGMLLFYVSICIPFCAFVFRSYFMTIPRELLEAASIDGANSLVIFVRIIFPMSWTAALVLFLTQFTFIWNDLLFGQVLAISDSARPIMPSLAAMSGSQDVQVGTVPQLMGSALLASVPALVLFLALRKRVMQGFVLH